MRSAPRTLWTAIVALLLPALLLLATPEPARAQLMIIGHDEKVSWDDAGKVVFGAPGKDTVSIVDISNREAPRVVASLPLMNSIFGPPTNLAITPDERLAIVANSMAPGAGAAPGRARLHGRDRLRRPRRGAIREISTVGGATPPR